MAAGARKDVVWDAGAGRDPRREALDIEAAIADALARNARLRHHRVVVSAGPDGLGHSDRGRVDAEPAPGGRADLLDGVWVRSLHDKLIVGR
jgi:hypothetical protein